LRGGQLSDGFGSTSFGFVANVMGEEGLRLGDGSRGGERSRGEAEEGRPKQGIQGVSFETGEGISVEGKAEFLSVGGGILEQVGAVCPEKSAVDDGVTTTVTIIEWVLIHEYRLMRPGEREGEVESGWQFRLANANLMGMIPARTPFYVSEDDAPAKRKIVTSALKLFARDGLCETSVRDIAAASGFTNPALFKHFANKDALAQYLFEVCYLELYQRVAKAMGAEETFALKQRAAIHAYLSVIDEDREAVLYVQDNLRHFWPRLPATMWKHSILGEVRKMLETGRREGAVVADIEIGFLTAAWVGTLQQFARAQFFGEFQQSSKTLAVTLEKLLTRMVRP
jgi:AcrR family transcriptional regulator